MAEKGQIYAYLAAVSDYHGTDCCELPTWKRDQELMYEGLTRGLHLLPDNIRIGGKDGYLSTAQFASAMADYRDKSCEEDTLLIYFSCHGSDGALVLSDGELLLQSVVDYTVESVILELDMRRIRHLRKGRQLLGTGSRNQSQQGKKKQCFLHKKLVLKGMKGIPFIPPFCFVIILSPSGWEKRSA